MSDKKRKVPKLRFPGFTDAWEQRKLGEIFSEYSLKNRADLPPLTVVQGLGTILRSDGNRNLLYDKSNLSNYKLVHKDDFIVHLRSFEAGFEKANSDGIVSPAYHVFHGKDTDTRFYYPFFRSKRFIEQTLTPHVYGIRDGRSIDIESMKSSYIPATSLIEQIRIGKFIDSFDSLISLHQRKLDNVKMLKKSLLQKLFPKDGEKIPELRFPGFTDAWEQRKVGEFLTESRVKGSNGKVSKKLTVKLWGKGVVEKNTIYRGSEATQYYTRFSGQFIYGKLDFLNQAFGIIPEELDGYESTLDSPAFDVSPALNKDFFLDYVSREQFYLVQGIIANGSRKAKRIHSDTFFEMPILLPEFNEQKVISNFTSKFDSLISLHQRKLDHLKELKKGLLQQMFV